MGYGDRLEILDSQSGVVTIARRGASAAERTPLPLLDARRVLSRIAADAWLGDGGVLVRIADLTAEPGVHSDNRTARDRLLERIEAALERGDILILSATGALPSGAGTATQTDRQGATTLGDFSFEGREFRLVNAQEFRSAPAADFDVIRFDFARTFLARVASTPGTSSIRVPTGATQPPRRPASAAGSGRSGERPPHALIR